MSNHTAPFRPATPERIAALGEVLHPGGEPPQLGDDRRASVTAQNPDHGELWEWR